MVDETRLREISELLRAMPQTAREDLAIKIINEMGGYAFLREVHTTRPEAFATWPLAWREMVSRKG